MFEQFGTGSVLHAQPQPDAGGELRLGCRRRVHAHQGPRCPRCHLFPRQPDQQDQRVRLRARRRQIHGRATCLARARARASRSRRATSSPAMSARRRLYLSRMPRDPNGEREVRRPPHAARADLAYAFAGGRGTANLAAIYNGRMDDSVFAWSAPVSSSPPTACLPFFFSSQGGSSSATTGSSTPPPPTSCSRAWSCSEGLRMLLDQQYQEVFGFNAPADHGLRRASS